MLGKKSYIRINVFIYDRYRIQLSKKVSEWKDETLKMRLKT